MNKPYSSNKFDRQAYKYCPNISPGWTHGLRTIGLSESDLESKLILDVGCGNEGIVLGEAKNIIGIDPNLGIMRLDGNGEHLGNWQIRYPRKSFRALAEELPFADGVFDFAISTKAVGWYPQSINFHMAVYEMLRVIKKETGVIAFNIGQNMTHSVLQHTARILHRDQYRISETHSWISIVHPEFVPDAK